MAVALPPRALTPQALPLDDTRGAVLPAVRPGAHWIAPSTTFGVDAVVFAAVGVLMTWAGGSNAGVFVGALPVLLLSLVVSGAYDPTRFHPAEELRTVARTSGVALSAYGFGLAGLTDLATAIVFAGVAATTVAALVAARALHRVVVARAPWWGSKTVVISSGTAGDDVVRTFETWPEIGFRTEAVLRANDAASWRAASEQAIQLAHDRRASTLIVAAPDLPARPLFDLVRRESRFYRRVLVVPAAPGSGIAWTTRREVRGLFGYGIRHAALDRRSRFVKRALDLVFSLIALVALLPVLVGVALVVRLSSPGRIFYRQLRMRQDGRCFWVLKFRTMYADADRRLEALLAEDPKQREEYARFHKLRDDPRVTPAGRWLRRHSLDELPQLLNVLRGEMSLVGPRAYMPGELDDMNGLARVVLDTRPGVTGLWQVSGRNRLSFDERVRLDAHYVQSWSLWLDLYLLARTVPVVLTGEGAS